MTNTAYVYIMSDPLSDQPKKTKHTSVLSMFILLIISLITVVCSHFYEKGEIAPLPLPCFLGSLIVLLVISLIFDVLRDWEGRAERNTERQIMGVSYHHWTHCRAHIREAQVITWYWKVKTLLLLHSNAFLIFIGFVFLSFLKNLLQFQFFKKYEIIIIALEIAVHLFFILLIFYGGTLFFTELYLDLEYVEEKLLTDRRALMEEMEHILRTKVTLKTEYRTLDV